MTKRDPGLDVLRCLAVVLVMFRHYYVSDWLTRGGWIGVDLFFVLSGFLVSGLLFKEFRKTGRIEGTRFLVRRGFKIYPAFWFVLVLIACYLSYKGIGWTGREIAAELLFVQNFFPGIMGISWTLAIEEHFYFFLILMATIAVRRNWISRKRYVVSFCLFILVACLVARVCAFIFRQPFNEWTHFFPTYLRIDALIFGVLLSWFAHFEEGHYRNFVSTYKFLIAGVSILFVSIPFFVELTNPLFYTAGLSILYLGFGGMVALVSVFKMPATKPVMILAGIGRFSYTIYLVHLITGPAVANFFRLHVLGNGPPLLYAFISFGANICFGIIISLLVEQFFLRIRERYFPKTY